MKDPSRLQQAELFGKGLGGISIGAHGLGHLGSVSPTRTVVGRTSAYTPLNASRAAPAALALDLS